MKDKEFSLDHLGHLTFILKLGKEEFPCGTVNYGSGVVTAVTWVTAVVQVWSLAQDLPNAVGMAKKKN